ncbi:MAG: DUF1116 domain-containing protein [Lachnospiraceae bacterium]|nr:DUF1116 domain-containing protein [Lachnospiraceae bacterium]
MTVREANAEVIERLQKAEVFLTGAGRASEHIGFLSAGKSLLHSGPPVDWDDMCSAMKNAVCGAAVYEGWARDPSEAAEMARSGRIRFASANDYHAVGPMAGIISPSMPVWLFENRTYGNRAAVTFNEGLGRTLRFGANGEDVIKRLKWMEECLGPIMSEALELSGPVSLTEIVSRGIQRGDEAHNRNKACTGLFIRKMAPYIALTRAGREEIYEVLKFFDGNDHTFLNLSMGLSKCTMEAAYGVPGSTIVTCMCTNGHEFGIHVSGLGEKWITAPAPYAKGNYFKGYGAEDANPAMGDSYVSETNGLGGFAMGAAPGLGKFIGITPRECMQASAAMYSITCAEHERFRIPFMGYSGTPLGIDVRKVLDTGILPVINTGIAHKEPDVGQIGAGIVYPPVEVFKKAMLLLEQGQE